MKPTEYFVDFINYYLRAKYLEECNDYRIQHNCLNMVFEPCGDDLQDNVHIFNNVKRKNAGFSKVLEDLHSRRLDRYRPNSHTEIEFRYLELIHRITGSGADFSQNHGYRNSCVLELEKFPSPSIFHISDQIQTWDFERTRKIFTSIGNQIPPFPKPYPPFTRGGFMYLAVYAPRLAQDYWNWVTVESSKRGPVPQREATDWVLEWHVKYGLKKFHFVLTAWCMDTAEYSPEYADRTSLTYYGKNALEALNLMFERTGNKAKFYDEAVLYIIKSLADEHGVEVFPYDLEDVLCDAVRFWENYVPNRDYNHIDKTKIFNSSSIKDHPKGRQKWMMK